jgi:hypothetical protein
MCRPTAVVHLIDECALHTSLFIPLFDELACEGVHGVLTGGRHVQRAVYVPHIYMTQVFAYAREMFATHGYVGTSQSHLRFMIFGQI